MPDREFSEDERIPVAAQRPRRDEREPRRGVRDGSGAGLTAIVIAVAFAALGGWLGSLVGLPYAGTAVFGLVGVVAAAAAVIWRF